MTQNTKPEEVTALPIKLAEHSMAPQDSVTVDPNTLPLEDIPAYVKAIGRRMAIDAWLVGKALGRAKKLVQEEHRAGWRKGGWREWCETQLGVSHETARKWIRITEHFDSKDKLEGLTLEEAYLATGSKKTRKLEVKNPQKGNKKEQKSTEGTPASNHSIQSEVYQAPANAGSSVGVPLITGELNKGNCPDDEESGDGPITTVPVATDVKVTNPVVEESNEEDSLDDEDWGTSSDDEEGREAVEDLLDKSFKHLDGVNGATTLAAAKAAAKYVRSCLIQLAEVLNF